MGKQTTTTSGVSRRSLMATGAGLAVTSAAVVTGMPAAGASDSDRGRSSIAAQDWVDIYQARMNYALGSDLIAADQFDAGRDRYRAAFTSDAQVSGGFDPASPLFSAVGPDDLAAVVHGLVAANRASQHLVGTVSISEGERNRWTRTADIIAYVQATVVLRDAPQVQRYLATYYEQAERRSRGWRLTRSFAQYVVIEDPAPRQYPPQED